MQGILISAKSRLSYDSELFFCFLYVTDDVLTDTGPIEGSCSCFDGYRSTCK